MDSNNGIFQSTNIPLYLFEGLDKVYYDSNNSLHIGKTNVENFINLNIQHENSAGMNNNYNNGGMHIKRFQRRRRRRRNAMGVLEERPM